MKPISPRILVVDDEPGITLLCERLLRRAGFSVAALTSAQAALEHLRLQPVDLLVVDIRMPELDGFDLITHAQQLQPEIAILIMTGFGTIETAIRALRQGVDGLLLKPFAEGAELIQAVRQALSDHQKKQDASRLPTLRALFQVSEALFSETDSQRLGEFIVQAIHTHLRASQAACYQREGEALRVIAGHLGLSSAASGVLWRMLEDGQPRLIQFEDADAETAKLLSEAGVTSAMFVPMARREMAHLYYAGRNDVAFRPLDLEMFVLLAGQASAALENARLYADLRDYVRRVEESQQALIQAEKMATVGRLTASIAHEVNNPLQALQNCLHLADHPGLSPAERQRYFELAKKELERLRTIVGQMLNFYRPTAEKEPLSLTEIWEHVLSLMSGTLEEHRIQVETRWPAEMPLILGARAQLQQVFLNLVLNAIEAMPQGGTLRLWARRISRSLDTYIQDSGPGIPLEIRSHIFEPFFSTKHGGTGLGLTVSYNIITAHGGQLDLITDRPGGACFRIRLPVVEVV